MRGALDTIVSQTNNLRIIPADAGSTPYISVGILIVRDHPRGCGEHFVSNPTVAVCPGSSPRMRGALLDGSGRRAGGGIIPADAGNTVSKRHLP